MLRGLWCLAWLGFRFSPRACYAWRNMLLRLFGAKLGRGVQVFPTCRIQFPWNLELGDQVVLAWGVKIYNLGPIKIGNRVVVSQFAHLCAGTHDFQSAGFALIKSPITIGDHVWIATEAFIGPNVQVASHVVIGARAVVMRSTESHAVYAGNPARKIRAIDEVFASAYEPL